ncbi:MAG: hypothetical protein RR909_01445 [Bacilli bacterium]
MKKKLGLKITLLVLLIILFALSTFCLVPMIHYVVTFSPMNSFMRLPDAIITVIILTILSISSLIGIIIVIIKIYKQTKR